MRGLICGFFLLRASVLAAQTPGLQKVASIGCADCGGPAQFAEIADVAVTATGQVWVADKDDPRIRVFTSKGQPIRSFGRRGEGPGEYEGIEKLFPAMDGSVAIVDMRLFRLTRVDTLGKARSTVSLRNFPFDAASAPGSSTIHLLFSRFQPGTSVVVRAGGGEDSLVQLLGPLRDFPGEDAPAEIHSLAVAPDGSIAVGDGESEYRVRVFRGGRWRDITRDIPRKLRTPAEIAEMESQVIGGGRKARAEGGRPSTAVPREKPHFYWLGLRYDSAGRLWVKTGRGDETRTVFDLFAPSGAYIGEVVVPGRVSSFSLAGNYLVTAGENDDGVPQVTTWIFR
jgi:hypothetical protein